MVKIIFMLLDILIVCLVLVAIIIGFVRGFIKSIAFITGLVLGVYFARQKYLLLEKFLFKSTQTSSTYHIISFLIVFVIIFLLIFLLGLLLRKIIQVIMLGWIDKLLGGFFGLIKGLILIWLILILSLVLFPKTQKIINKSVLAKKIIELGARVTKLPIKISLPVKAKILADNHHFTHSAPN
ncbi:MAG: CvpA family protein [candidate division WOR-3 bacterium]|nr:CvpA family protein [candidate division WOR-3 bacterium]